MDKSKILNGKNKRVKESKSEGKLPQRISQSTMYSVMTGKRIKTSQEFHQSIKNKRVQSYQKISFNIRKMDQLFKQENKHGKSKSNFSLEGENMEQSNPVKSKVKKLNIKVEHLINSQQKLNTQSLQTYTDFFSPSKQSKGNLINRGQLLNGVIKGKSQSPIKKRFRQDLLRIKTEHIQNQTDVGNIQQQLLSRKKTFSIYQGKNNNRIIRQLSNDRQEEQVVIKNCLPGVKFKFNRVATEQNHEIEVIDSKHSSFYLQKSSYIHKDELLQLDQDRRISKMYDLRSQQSLNDSPKQWHLYNCLKLNQLALYRTNLKLSCDQWVLLDYLELKYLRGWHPQQVGQFNIGVKLLVARLILNLQKENDINFQNIRIKITNSTVRSKMQDNSSILVESDFSLPTNTMISLWDLFIGMLITKKQDLIWYVIYSIGYLFRNYNLQTGQKNEQLQYCQIIIQSDKQKLKQYEKIFLMKSQQIIQVLKLKDTSIEVKGKKMQTFKNQKAVWGANPISAIHKQGNVFEYMFIKSTPVDMSVLMIDCLRYTIFGKVLVQSRLGHRCRIKHQVGYKYWQNRGHYWKNQFAYYYKNDFLVFTSRNEQSKMISIIAYQWTDQVVIVCNDIKLNMSFRDITSIQQWMHITFKRFRKPQRSRQTVVIENYQIGQQE